MAARSGVKRQSTPRSRASARSRFRSRGYLAKSSAGPNWSGLTKTDVTTRSADSRARSTRRRWPSCSAPMVGTNATRAPRARWARVQARMSGSPVISCIGPREGLLGEGVVGVRILPRTHFRLERLGRLPDVVGEGRVLLDELGREAVVQAQHVVEHQ